MRIIGVKPTWTFVATAIAALSIAVGPAHAETYPSKPIHLIVPFAAGGGVDICARIVGQKMSESLGQQVVVENKPGAGTIVGAEYVARSNPDGYTFLLTTNGHTILPSLSKLPWDPIKDFTPVTMVVSYPFLLVVNPSVPAKSLPELIALAKAEPGHLNYGSAGVGTAPQLAMELLKSAAAINVVHIPYKGNGPVTAAVLAGEIQMMLDTMVGPLPSIRAGKLRALAITSAVRSALLPDVPTFNEAGIPGYVFEGWNGLFAPANTPKDIVEKVRDEVVKALAITEVKQRLTEFGYLPVGDTPQHFSTVVSQDIAKNAKIIADAGIQVSGAEPAR
jgi:tripartite-type tricarboxylate transporter receptor subunit TctC